MYFRVTVAMAAEPVQHEVRMECTFLFSAESVNEVHPDMLPGRINNFTTKQMCSWLTFRCEPNSAQQVHQSDSKTATAA